MNKLKDVGERISVIYNQNEMKIIQRLAFYNNIIYIIAIITFSVIAIETNNKLGQIIFSSCNVYLFYERM